MVVRVPQPPNDDDTPAEGIEEMVTLLREAGEERREYGRELFRRLTAPQDELADELRDGGA